MHSVELPLQTPSDFDQMQPLPPPEATDKKKSVNKDNFNFAKLIMYYNLCSFDKDHSKHVNTPLLLI